MSWDDKAQLANLLSNQIKPVVLIERSYGADTAATLVACGYHVDTLVTLDPIRQVRPDFAAVAANTGHWIGYNAAWLAANLPIDPSNAIAAVGRKWAYGPAFCAETFANVSTRKNLSTNCKEVTVSLRI